jgi:ribosomal protein L2
MTFISNVEGNEEEGVFILNTNGSYVLMMDKNGEKVKAHIISKSNKLLHLKYDVDEIRDVEVHYIRSI